VVGSLPEGKEDEQEEEIDQGANENNLKEETRLEAQPIGSKSDCGGIYEQDESQTKDLTKAGTGDETWEEEQPCFNKEGSLLDEDDEISLQEIEVVHLDETTACSEVERLVIEQNDTATTAERLVIQDSEELVNPDSGEESEPNYANQSQEVETNPLRQSIFFGEESNANHSIPDPRSGSSIPISATESRANTSMAVLRGDLSFPVRLGESPTNTSLAVLRGDVSFPVRATASNADTSIQAMQSMSVENRSGEVADGGAAAAAAAHLRRDKMEKANHAAATDLDESVAAVQGRQSKEPEGFETKGEDDLLTSAEAAQRQLHMLPYKKDAADPQRPVHIESLVSYEER
jgi:hypothetical protein